MSKNATTYSILGVVDGTESVATAGITKKSKAVEQATALRNESGVAVRVVTSAGNVVLDLAAPKKIKMSKPYTRVVELPEGVTVPEGKRVAYFRPRVGLALLHDFTDEEGPYSILDVKLGRELPERFATTRDGGVFLRERAKARA